jgi:mannose/fructose-specific phosphotransferase system component IIA
MVGILIVAHGTLGESLIHCASHVLGSRPVNLMQVGVTIHDEPQQLLPQAIKLVRALTYRKEPLHVVVSKAMSGGVDGVTHMPAASRENAATGS